MKKLLVILSVLLSGCTGWFPTPNIYSGTVGWNPPQLSMAEGCPDLSGRYVDPRGNFFTYFLIGDDLNFYAKNIAPLFPEGYYADGRFKSSYAVPVITDITMKPKGYEVLLTINGKQAKYEVDYETLNRKKHEQLKGAYDSEGFVFYGCGRGAVIERDYGGGRATCAECFSSGSVGGDEKVIIKNAQGNLERIRLGSGRTGYIGGYSTASAWKEAFSKVVLKKYDSSSSVGGSEDSK